ncbi:MAG: hypothetical protein B7X90_13385 [Novosphingobium sp. 17-62-19]|nr:MAG: hypothetical protein B7X90_13385 [Novosphingobium sp. 17-62-19]
MLILSDERTNQECLFSTCYSILPRARRAQRQYSGLIAHEKLTSKTSVAESARMRLHIKSFA